MTLLCLFDCDGTLVDSAHAIVASMQQAFTECGLAPPSAAAVRGVIGLPLDTAIAALSDDGDGERLPSVGAAFLVAWGELTRHGARCEPLYPGVAETLDALAARGWLLGVATGKSKRSALATLAAHDLTHRFATVQTANDGAGKPAPDLIFNALRETGARREGTVMVGDSVYDMAMARNAQVRALGVGWGCHAGDALIGAGAEAVVHGFDEILAVLEAWFAGC